MELKTNRAFDNAYSPPGMLLSSSIFHLFQAVIVTQIKYQLQKEKNICIDKK